MRLGVRIWAMMAQKYRYLEMDTPGLVWFEISGIDVWAFLESGKIFVGIVVMFHISIPSFDYIPLLAML